MSPPVRSIGSSSSASGSGFGVAKFVKSLYRDEFRWSLVKSIGLFALGVAIARDARYDNSHFLFFLYLFQYYFFHGNEHLNPSRRWIEVLIS